MIVELYEALTGKSEEDKSKTKDTVALRKKYWGKMRSLPKDEMDRWARRWEGLEEALTGKSKEDKAETAKRFKKQYRVFDWGSGASDGYFSKLKDAKKYAKKLAADGYDNLRIYMEMYDVVEDDTLDEEELLWSYDAADDGDDLEVALKELDALTESAAAIFGKPTEDQEETKRLKNEPAYRISRNRDKIAYLEYRIHEKQAIVDQYRGKDEVTLSGIELASLASARNAIVAFHTGIQRVYKEIARDEALMGKPVDEALAGKSEEDKAATQARLRKVFIVSDMNTNMIHGLYSLTAAKELIKKRIRLNRADHVNIKLFRDFEYPETGESASGDEPVLLWSYDEMSGDWVGAKLKQLEGLTEALAGKSEEDKDLTKQKQEREYDKTRRRYNAAREQEKIGQVRDSQTPAVFDDFVVNDDDSDIADDMSSFWTQVCKKCNERYNFPSAYLSEGSAGTCGVKGCDRESDYYYDFESPKTFRIMTEALAGKTPEDQEATVLQREEDREKRRIHVGDTVEYMLPDRFYDNPELLNSTNLPGMTFDGVEASVKEVKGGDALVYFGHPYYDEFWVCTGYLRKVVNEALAGKTPEDKEETLKKAMKGLQVGSRVTYHGVGFPEMAPDSVGTVVKPVRGISQLWLIEVDFDKYGVKKCYRDSLAPVKESLRKDDQKLIKKLFN
jgi:hypothetical protein